MNTFDLQRHRLDLNQELNRIDRKLAQAQTARARAGIGGVNKELVTVVDAHLADLGRRRTAIRSDLLRLL